MKHVPGYVKHSLKEVLEAYTQQEAVVLRDKLILEEINLKIIEVFCPVKIGDLYRGKNFTIRVKKITWHYNDGPLGIYWELYGVVLKSDGAPNERFSGLHVIQCFDYSDRYWKEKVQEDDPTRFVGDCTCQIGTVYKDNSNCQRG